MLLESLLWNTNHAKLWSLHPGINVCLLEMNFILMKSLTIAQMLTRTVGDSCYNQMLEVRILGVITGKTMDVKEVDNFHSFLKLHLTAWERLMPCCEISLWISPNVQCNLQTEDVGSRDMH